MHAWHAAEKIDLAAAARRLTAAQVGIRERRRFRRMPIEVNGRLLDPLGREHDCRTADISPGDIRIAAPILPHVGERVVIYLAGFGRVSGHVAAQVRRRRSRHHFRLHRPQAREDGRAAHARR